MKKNNLLIVFIVCVTFFSVSCGGNKSKDRKMDSKLDSLITDLAACKEQNTNCEAYNKASEGIQAMAKDTSNKFLVDDLFNAIAKSDNGARSAACAHAINFWVGSSDHYKNAAYGRIILDALKKEKFDQKSYVGSTLGQLLSGWLVTDDEKLLTDIHATIKDKNTEKRGRMELIRLTSKNSFAKKGLTDLLITISKDATENEEIRKACLNVLWRAEEPSQYLKVEDLYLEFLSHESPVLLGSALEGLGYMKSVEGYNKVLETVEKFGANEAYCFATSRALTNYISYDKKEGIDPKKAFLLAIKMVNTTTLKPSYRNNYIYTIETFGGKEGIAVLTKLSTSKEKDIADPAKLALERLKSKK